MEANSVPEDGISAPRLLLSSQEYLIAASSLENNARTRFPKNLLYCISIELGLKAFLRAKGLRASELKKHYGHNLVKLLITARRKGLSLLKYKELLEYSKQYNLLYKRKGIEYIDDGTYSFLKTYGPLEKAIVELLKEIYFDVYLSIGIKAHQRNLDNFIKEMEAK